MFMRSSDSKHLSMGDICLGYSRFVNSDLLLHDRAHSKAKDYTICRVETLVGSPLTAQVPRYQVQSARFDQREGEKSRHGQRGICAANYDLTDLLTITKIDAIACDDNNRCVNVHPCENVP